MQASRYGAGKGGRRGVRLSVGSPTECGSMVGREERSIDMGDVSRQSDLARRILAMLADQSGLLLEQILEYCPDLTWNQVFAVVDHLSRTGDIRLTAKGMGRYRVDIQAAQHRLDIHG